MYQLYYCDDLLILKTFMGILMLRGIFKHGHNRLGVGFFLKFKHSSVKRRNGLFLSEFKIDISKLVKMHQIHPILNSFLNFPVISSVSCFEIVQNNKTFMFNKFIHTDQNL